MVQFLKNVSHVDFVIVNELRKENIWLCQLKQMNYMTHLCTKMVLNFGSAGGLNLNRAIGVMKLTAASMIKLLLINLLVIFSKSYTCNNQQRAAVLQAEYLTKRVGYSGASLLNEYLFDVELVGNVLSKLKRGKAAGLDALYRSKTASAFPSSAS